MLGNVPWIPQPLENPVADESLDSSSAKWVFNRLRRPEVVRVTCGSEVRSQVPPSSSMEDREANEDDVVEGGKIRSLILLCKHRGVGIASYKTRQSFITCLQKKGDFYIRGMGTLADVTYKEPTYL